MMSSVTIRMDEETKRQLLEIMQEAGTNLSEVTQRFYEQMIRERRLPIDGMDSDISV